MGYSIPYGVALSHVHMALKDEYSADFAGMRPVLEDQMFWLSLTVLLGSKRATRLHVMAYSHRYSNLAWRLIRLSVSELMGEGHDPSI